MGRYRSAFYPQPPRRFSAWQIELTTRCPLRCAMCVKASYPDYTRKDMDLEDFKKILPYLRDVEHVVLAGWGESNLHPRLVDCIRMAKGEGARA